jgi:hypothetical protein
MSMRLYPTLNRLRSGEIIEIEGLRLIGLEGEVGPGDLFVAERNTSPQLLTAKAVNTEQSYVLSVENAYPYDCSECVRVEEAI